MTDWQDISTAPKDVEFLVHLKCGYISRGRLVNGKYLAFDSSGPVTLRTDTTVTHWMPLPDPPTTSIKEDAMTLPDAMRLLKRARDAWENQAERDLGCMRACREIAKAFEREGD